LSGFIVLSGLAQIKRQERIRSYPANSLEFVVLT
jgi:hypothetical protein